jgi:hypothetical protein
VAQAAEGFIRRDRGLTGVGDVTIRSVTRSDDEATVRMSTPDGDLRVRVGVEPGAERILTCRSAHALAPPVYRLLDVTPVSA